MVVNDEAKFSAAVCAAIMQAFHRACPRNGSASGMLARTDNPVRVGS